MIKSITKKTNNKKGFTLIELIVVIAILGILAAIAIPRFAAVQENSRVAADKASARTLVSAGNVKFSEDGKLDEGSLNDALKPYVSTWTKVAANTSAKTGEELVISNIGSESSPVLVVYAGTGGEVIYSEDTSATTPVVPTAPYN